jgi:hypothetical protein
MFALYGLMGVCYIFEKKQLDSYVENLTIFVGSCQFSRVGTMGKSKQSRAANERLKNQYRFTNSGQFAGKDDEEKETDTDQMVEELTETLVATRQHEQEALTAAQDAVDAMQMMPGMEQNDDVELLLRDMVGNEISVSDYFNREVELRYVDPEEDDPEDGPEVFVINEEEESGDEIIATESWKFLKDANTKWKKQPRKIMQRGASARSERRKKHDAMMRAKSATATGQKSILGFLQKADVDYDTEDEMNDGGKIIEGQDDEEIVGDKFTMQEAIDHLSGFEAKITRNAKDDKKDPSMMWQKVEKQAGFYFMLYPKYHCELNYIEMVWGYIKAYHRRHCTYSFNDLDGANGLVRTLNERIPLTFVRRAANHCLRYMSFYRAGLHGPELEFAVRKYRSHRAISSEQKSMIKSEFETYMNKKRK